MFQIYIYIYIILLASFLEIHFFIIHKTKTQVLWRHFLPQVLKLQIANESTRTRVSGGGACMRLLHEPFEHGRPQFHASVLRCAQKHRLRDCAQALQRAGIAHVYRARGVPRLLCRRGRRRFELSILPCALYCCCQPGRVWARLARDHGESLCLPFFSPNFFLCPFFFPFNHS